MHRSPVHLMVPTVVARSVARVGIPRVVSWRLVIEVVVIFFGRSPVRTLYKLRSAPASERLGASSVVLLPVVHVVVMVQQRLGDLLGLRIVVRASENQRPFYQRQTCVIEK